MEAFGISLIASAASGFISCLIFRKNINASKSNLKKIQKIYKHVSIFTILVCTFFMYFIADYVLDLFGIHSNHGHGSAIVGSTFIGFFLSAFSHFFGYYCLDIENIFHS